MSSSLEQNKKGLSNNEIEKSLAVAKTDQLSNFKLIQDLSKVADYMDNIEML